MYTFNYESTVPFNTCFHSINIWISAMLGRIYIFVERPSWAGGCGSSGTVPASQKFSEAVEGQDAYIYTS
jgi:hypothetical protein